MAAQEQSGYQQGNAANIDGSVFGIFQDHLPEQNEDCRQEEEAEPKLCVQKICQWNGQENRNRCIPNLIF